MVKHSIIPRILSHLLGSNYPKNMVLTTSYPTKERKRQYSALRRAVHRSANPALITKIAHCSDTERPSLSNLLYHVLDVNSSESLIDTRVSGTYHESAHRFGMLKAWLVNDSLDSIHVEEKYLKILEETRWHCSSIYLIHFFAGCC